MNNGVERALEIARQFGEVEGSHHKMWVIDQMVRELTGDNYITWVRETRARNGRYTYDWDTGIAP